MRSFSGTAGGFRVDLIVERKVIVPLKSVEKVHSAHKKQLLTYLKLTGLRLGFLLSFGEALMKDGITRTINPLMISPCLCVFVRNMIDRAVNWTALRGTSYRER